MKVTSVAIATLIVCLWSEVTGHGVQNHRNAYRRRFRISGVTVCGNDGITYLNEDVLNKAIWKNPKLRKVYDGICESVYGIVLRGAVFDPVCADDYRTYSNVIYMKLSACMTGIKKTVLSKGFCSRGRNFNLVVPKCSLGCPEVIDFVCGSDGNTYVNECALEKQNCLLGGKALQKKHNGVCEAAHNVVEEEEPFDPVCGNDGNTYSSSFFLNFAKCVRPQLKFVKKGPCKSM